MADNLSAQTQAMTPAAVPNHTVQDAGALQKRRWRELGVHTYVRALIIGALLYYLFHREIASIVYRWVTDSSWSHGFLIPLFSLYFLNQKKEEILNQQGRPNYTGLVFLVCTILFYVFNVVSPSGYGYFRSVCFIPAIGSVILLLGGWGLVRYTWLPVGFLIFAVPLPESYYAGLTIPMRQWAATVATALLNMVSGLEATVNGVVIDVVYKGQRIEPALDVAEACSGMRLLMAFLALGVAMAYLHYRPIWQRLVLLASTIPIAILCNIIRVAITGFIYILIDPAYAQGIYHDMLGMAMLLLAFGLYGCLAWFMANLFVEEGAEPVADVVVRTRLGEGKDRASEGRGRRAEP
jgi:exosortase